MHVSLLGNCTSQVTVVTGLSLQIFVSLMDGFKEHLKTEFEVFFTSVFIKILESENSTHDQKQRVLEGIPLHLQGQHQSAGVFVNYDCDLDSTDIFKRIVDGYSRIVKASGTDGSEAGSDPNVASRLKEEDLRWKGLEGLVMILQSLLQLKGLQDVTVGMVADAHTPSTSHSQHGGTGVGGGEKEKEEEETASPPLGSPVDGSSSSISSSSSSRVDAFDRKQRMQEQIEVGILKFSRVQERADLPGGV